MRNGTILTLHFIPNNKLYTNRFQMPYNVARVCVIELLNNAFFEFDCSPIGNRAFGESASVFEVGVERPIGVQNFIAIKQPLSIVLYSHWIRLPLCQTGKVWGVRRRSRCPAGERRSHELSPREEEWAIFESFPCVYCRQMASDTPRKGWKVFL